MGSQVLRFLMQLDRVIDCSFTNFIYTSCFYLVSFNMFLLSFSVVHSLLLAALYCSQSLTRICTSTTRQHDGPLVYIYAHHTRHYSWSRQLIESSLSVIYTRHIIFSLFCMEAPHLAGNNNNDDDGGTKPPRRHRCEILCRILRAWFCCDWSEGEPKRNRAAVSMV